VSEVSYQSFLPGGAADAGSRFEALPGDAISTRGKDATQKLTIRVSKKQRRWLDRVAAGSGDGVDQDAVVRCLIDLGRQLEVDWALIAGGGQLRDAVRDAVRVRRTGAS
jgi:hypothetical protein